MSLKAELIVSQICSFVEIPLREYFFDTMLYSELIYQIEKDAELRIQLKQLYDWYINNGMILSAEAVDSRLDPVIWQRENLVAYDTSENRWLIQPGNLFATYVLSTKVPDLYERLPLDLAGLRQLYETASERPNSSFTSNGMRLRECIFELILRFIHESTQTDFSNWIGELSHESNQWIQFEFLEAYCGVADDLPLPGKSIADACSQFLIWRDGAAEINVNKLLVRYAINNHEAATALLLSRIDSVERGIQSGLLGGLLEGNAERCWPVVEELYKSSKYQAFIMNALPRRSLPNAETAWKALTLLLSYDRTSDINRLNMPFALTRIADRIAFEDNDIIIQCYDELISLAQIEHVQTVKCVLSALRLPVEKYPTQSVDVLLKLLANPVMTHEYIGKLNYHPSFDDILSDVTDVELTFTFFEAYARRYAVHFKHDTFYSTIFKSYMRPATKSAFQRKVLDCLVHDEGAIRMFGNGLLDFFHHYGNPFEFDQDISQLPPIIQYKLWMSVLVLYKNPKQTIPLVATLLKSNNPIVAEAMLCKLEVMIECYHNEVIHAVENYANQQANMDTRVSTALTRLKFHYAKFCQQLNEKEHIPELRPALCQTAIYARFNERHSHKMNERMNTVMEESGGLISMFKRVVLAKGGGWKHNKHEEISKLGQIQSSYTWPRLYLVNPEAFDMEHRLHYAANWKSDKSNFLEWITE